MSFTSVRDDTRNDDSLDLYLREISAYPLLAREDEFGLAQRIREGDEEALDILVRSNLRFVVSVAKKYQNQGVALGDLINEGNLGLIRAARRFDEARGVKFISYAVWWVRQAILQALAEQGRVVRVPLNRASMMHRIGKRRSALIQELGREPTVGEMAEELDIGHDEIERALTLSRSHLSLDAPLAPGQDSRLLDFMPDVIAAPTDSDTYESALSNTIEEALSTLSAREARILRLYFGIDGQKPKTLEEIGKLIGVTRERVRQIKQRAIDRMRHASRARFLDSFHN